MERMHNVRSMKKPCLLTFLMRKERGTKSGENKRKHTVFSRWIHSFIPDVMQPGYGNFITKCSI